MSEKIPTDTLNCAFDQGTLSVGQKITLTCKIEGFAVPPGAVVQFSNLNTNSNYEIQFLGPPKVSSDLITQMATSYKVGPHELNLLKVAIGDQEFLVSKQSLQVTSVMPPTAPKQAEGDSSGNQSSTAEPTPFPIFDPIQVGVPWWWWTLWGVLFTLIISFFIYKFVQWKKARKILASAETEAKLLTPAEKFRQRLRKLESQGFHQRGEYKSFALELTATLKAAFTAQLKFPAEDMTSEEVNSYLERRHKVLYKRIGSDLAGIFSDLDKIKFAKVETDAANCLALLDLSMKIGVVLFEGQL